MLSCSLNSKNSKKQLLRLDLSSWDIHHLLTSFSTNRKKGAVYVDILRKNKIIPSEEVTVFCYITHVESGYKVEPILRAT